MSEERRKEKQPPRTFMMRDAKSRIDEAADRTLTAALPLGWVINTLHTDYAKDQHIEITEPIVWQGEVTEKVTGKTIYVQRKGTKDVNLRYGGSVLAFELETRHLTHWADETRLPVFLVVVDITENKVYWLFIQRYLAEETAWRGQGSFTVHIPVENELSNFPKFEQAVEEACEYMRLAKCTVRERVDFETDRLEQKDPRFRVEPRINGQNEEYIFIAREPVQFTLFAACNSPETMTKFADMIDRGVRVNFAPGEIAFTGSPVLEEFAARGGGMQVSSSYSGWVTLTSLNEQDEPMGKWENLQGVFEGGRKEFRFTSNLNNSPVSVRLDPLGQGIGGSIYLNSNLTVWINQPLLALSYYDQMSRFFKAVVDHPRLRIEGYYNGNRFFSVTATLDGTDVYRRVLRFLEIVEKARRVARYFNINPICSLNNLGTEYLPHILITHDILFNEHGFRNEHPHPDTEVVLSMQKSEAQRFALAQVQELPDLVLPHNVGDEGEFMGVSVNAGFLVTCITNPRMVFSLAELQERIDLTAETDLVNIPFGCSEKSVYSIRKATPEEIASIFSAD